MLAIADDTALEVDYLAGGPESILKDMKNR